MRKFVREAGLQDRILVDSAGTHDYHSGAAPDLRAQIVAKRRGYELSGLRARQITSADFAAFDLVLGMDFNNLERLQDMCPPEHRGKLGLLMPYATKRRALIIHDPYYRSAKEFTLVLDYIEDACEGLVRALMAEAAPAASVERSTLVQRRKGMPEPPSAARAANSGGLR